MRASTLFASLAVLLPLAIADPSPAPEPCSDHPGFVHDGSNLSPEVVVVTPSKGHWSYTPSSPKNRTPKVGNPSRSTLTTGAQQAVGQFLASRLIPPGLQSSLTDALGQAIQIQLSGGVINVTKTNTIHRAVVTKIPNPARPKFVNGKLVPVDPITVTVTVTENVTQTVTSDVSSASAVSAAALNVQSAINQAFASANLSQSGLDNDTVSALEDCLTTVLSSGGLPSGYACLTSSGSNSAGLQATLTNILEQFEGILPNIILQNVFNAVTPSLTALLPASEQDLVSEIEASIQSVIATLSSSSVTAMEQLSTCYTAAIRIQGNTSSLACFSQSAASTLATLSNSVIESFTGVLPGSLISTVENILSYNLQNETTASDSLAAKVQAQISNAINSAGNTLSGNTVSLAETLQACATLLLQTGNGTAAQECITNGNAPVLSQTIILGIAEQFEGYLPSSFFTDLVQEAQPLIANITASDPDSTISEAEIDAALNSYFNNATQYGPAYETCIEQVQECVLNAVQKSGTIGAVCPGPVDGCDLPPPPVTYSDNKVKVKREEGLLDSVFSRHKKNRRNHS